MTGERQLLNQIAPYNYNSFVLDGIYGNMQIYLLIVSKNNILKLIKKTLQSFQQYEMCGFYWVEFEHWGERVLLRLKSFIHNLLTSVCRSGEALSSFFSKPFF